MLIVRLVPGANPVYRVQLQQPAYYKLKDRVIYGL